MLATWHCVKKKDPTPGDMQSGDTYNPDEVNTRCNGELKGLVNKI
jgi:hypothetical protein